MIWNHEFSDDIYLYLNRSNNVIPSPLKIEFRQQIAGTRRSEPVGKVEIELSEFIGSEKTPKQYLLDASRMNSMAIITISLSPSANDEIS